MSTGPGLGPAAAQAPAPSAPPVRARVGGSGDAPRRTGLGLGDTLRGGDGAKSGWGHRSQGSGYPSSAGVDRRSASGTLGLLKTEGELEGDVLVNCGGLRESARRVVGNAGGGRPASLSAPSVGQNRACGMAWPLGEARGDGDTEGVLSRGMAAKKGLGGHRCPDPSAAMEGGLGGTTGRRLLGLTESGLTEGPMEEEAPVEVAAPGAHFFVEVDVDVDVEAVVSLSPKAAASPFSRELRVVVVQHPNSELLRVVRVRSADSRMSSAMDAASDATLNSRNMVSMRANSKDRRRAVGLLCTGDAGNVVSTNFGVLWPAGLRVNMVCPRGGLP